MSDKKYTISFRYDKDTLNNLEYLKSVHAKHNRLIIPCISNSDIIRNLIRLASRLDLEDERTFMELFGECNPDTFKDIIDHKNSLVIIKK